MSLKRLIFICKEKSIIYGLIFKGKGKSVLYRLIFNWLKKTCLIWVNI